MGDLLKHRELTDLIIGTFYEVYNELGFGFLESVYEEAMMIALQARNLKAKQQTPISVWFRGKIVGNFTADLVIENAIIIELKAVRTLEEVHKAQLLNYLRATDVEVGLLLNFGHRPEFKRLAFDNERKKQQRSKSLINELLAEE